MERSLSSCDCISTVSNTAWNLSGCAIMLFLSRQFLAIFHPCSKILTRIDWEWIWKRHLSITISITVQGSFLLYEERDHFYRNWTRLDQEQIIVAHQQDHKLLVILYIKTCGHRQFRNYQKNWTKNSKVCAANLNEPITVEKIRIMIVPLGTWR